jgi:dihydrofolate synthase/folylpolyglutamate synthase
MSVDLDHMDYLGPTRESIGFEKAGIFRAGRPAICGDPKPPATLTEESKRTGAALLVRGRDFGFEERGRQWRYWGPESERHGLPHPALRGEYQLANASACITAVDALKSRLAVAAHDIRGGLLEAEQPGRFQALPGYPLVILDVAHNPAAAKALAQNLKRLPKELSGRTLAVFAMLKDKDIAGVVAAVKDRVDEWLVAGTPGERGAEASLLASVLARAGVLEAVSTHADVADAYAQACDRATKNDKIVIFGSFNTVAAVLASRERQRAAGSALKRNV